MTFHNQEDEEGERLKPIGIILVHLGVVALAITATGIRAPGQHDVCFLERNYGPKAQPETATYACLYGWTKFLHASVISVVKLVLSAGRI